MTQHKLCQFIIKKYISGEINWPREIKIAKKLINKFKDFKFWHNLNQLKIPPPSLAWFLKAEGKAFLLKEYEKFNLNFNKKEIKIEDYKVAEDKKICKKPKTLIQFLKG